MMLFIGFTGSEVMFHMVIWIVEMFLAFDQHRFYAFFTSFDITTSTAFVMQNLQVAHRTFAMSL